MWGVNIQSGVSPSDKINILESPKTVFFSQKPGSIHKVGRPFFYF